MGCVLEASGLRLQPLDHSKSRCLDVHWDEFRGTVVHDLRYPHYAESQSKGRCEIPYCMHGDGDGDVYTRDGAIETNNLRGLVGCGE